MARKKKSEQPPKQIQEILRRQAILNEWYAEEPDEEKERLLAERNAALALIEKIEAEIKRWRNKA